MGTFSKINEKFSNVTWLHSLTLNFEADFFRVVSHKYKTRKLSCELSSHNKVTTIVCLVWPSHTSRTDSLGDQIINNLMRNSQNTDHTASRAVELKFYDLTGTGRVSFVLPQVKDTVLLKSYSIKFVNSLEFSFVYLGLSVVH